MAMSAEKIDPLPLTGEISNPFAMDASLPVFKNKAMTFATEPITLCEVDELPVVKPQFVAISCIVAIKAPSHRLRVMEFDLGMFYP
jgi:hypothetical protein